jgi:hypothetical protein
MTVDLRDRIESSFGDGPPHPSIHVRLDAGRRALRRRRLASSGATAAVVAALAFTSYLASRMNDDAARTIPISRPTQSSEPTPSTSENQDGRNQHTSTTIAPGHTYAQDPIPREDSPVRFAGDRLVAKDGAHITARVADPAVSSAAVPAGCTARAAAVTDAGTDLFVLGYTCPHGAWDLFTETAGARADTLPAWLEAVKTAQDGGEGVR